MDMDFRELVSDATHLGLRLGRLDELHPFCHDDLLCSPTPTAFTKASVALEPSGQLHSGHNLHLHIQLSKY